MSSGSQGEKTEQPSGRRISQAREKGNVAFSADVNNAVVLLSGIVLLYALSIMTYNGFNANMKETFGNLSRRDFNQDAVVNLFVNHVYQLVKIILPILGGILLCGLAVSYFQTGFMLNFGLLKPKFDKLNVIAGLKNLFSTRSYIKLIFSVVKIIVVGGVAFLVVRKEFGQLIHSSDLTLAQMLAMLAKSMYTLALRISIVLLILAVLDFVYQKWQHKRNLRMTKQEVKDEGKETEGDPFVKGKIRAAQRHMAMKRMMSSLPAADVVVTNPTHYAVALKYEGSSMKAPSVVAKGADLIAKRIKEIAAKHNIPVVEDKPLAQTLYKTVEVGQEIPQKLYYAVAKVLSYVYQLKKEQKKV